MLLRNLRVCTSVLTQSVQRYLPGAVPLDQQHRLLQTPLITQLKYIEDHLYSAKDPSLNRDLSCHSTVKTKCVTLVGFTGVRKALLTGFE